MDLHTSLNRAAGNVPCYAEFLMYGVRLMPQNKCSMVCNPVTSKVYAECDSVYKAEPSTAKRIFKRNFRAYILEDSTKRGMML